ncbi:hypothetical protein I3843_03G111800 [Carya illinoinensis]|uniref:aspartic proteinase Asp1-like isoform X1 n=1 Tax=Carya illinoinensis TaxID=32201 RepID=UPI001C722393|nr:aspartic proteinase Asp1-like isoform X1 [Carya illinoinensis]KAG7987021.1 hypothetical protein I3843_03G111800 [Carya illinoinensis]
MKEEDQVGVMLLLQVLQLVLLLSLCELSSSSLALNYVDHQHQQNGRKSVQPITEAIASLLLNRDFKSSVVFPIDGNVYPIGFYNVTLHIGQPSKPYFLDPDTGSDLTWLQCEPCFACTEAPHPPYKHNNDYVVPPEDPLCKSLQPPGDYKSKTPSRCDYEIQYADGFSSRGFLVKDVFSLNFTGGKTTKPLLALGCGYDQTPGPGPYHHHPSDGMLGLGKGKSSILSQLNEQGYVRNVIGHCFKGQGGGYLFFGDDLYDPSSLSWTQMSPKHPEHYSPGDAELIFGGKTTGIKKLRTVFDSGTSYTYLDSHAYGTLTDLVKKEASEKKLTVAENDQTLSLCWEGPFKSLEEASKYFKPMALSFNSTDGKARVEFELPPDAYLILSDFKNVCLGILNGTEEGATFNIIGDISMQGKMVIFDNENQLIGWHPDKCDPFPKSKAVSI